MARTLTIQEKIEKNINELLARNAISDLDATLSGLQEKLKKDLEDKRFRLTKKVLVRMIEEIVWKDDKEGSPLRSLRDTVRHDIPLEEFSTYYPNIPVWLRDKKARELRGLVSGTRSAAFLRGIGRLPIEGIKPVKLPNASFSRPFHISLPVENENKETWHGDIINGANIGLPFTPLIEDNVVRRALADAEHNKSQFVILTNIIDIETKKAAGPLRVLRELVSGRNINPAVFDADYVGTVNRILAEVPDEEVIYEQRNEVFENLMGGWYKIAHSPKGETPEYNGPVFVVVGFKEEQFAAAAAYWAVGYYNHLAQNKIAVQKRMAQKALANANNNEDDAEIARCKKLLETVQKEEARTRITNVGVEWKRFFKRALSYIVKRIEETIPNARVIGKGTSFVQAGDKIIEINIPSHITVTGSLLSNRVRSYGQDVLSGRASDLVVICHPYATNFSITAREVDSKGRRTKRGLICVAPIVVDDEAIREETKEIIHKGAHPILKTVFANQFSGGVVRIENIDGVLSASAVASRALASHNNKRTPVQEALAGKYIWYLEATDHHHGGRGREQIWCKEKEDYLGVCEATYHLLRKSGYGRENLPPIHFFSANDDLVQGNHFDTHKHPHPHELHYNEIQEHVAGLKDKILRARNKSTRAQLLAELQMFLLYQIEVRGIDSLSNQIIEMYTRHLEPSADIYSGILQRAMRSGLIIRGISDIIDQPEILRDGRDIGFINWGSGNHFFKTTDGHLTEGGIYATNLQLMLRAFPEWSGKDALLKKLIASPLYSSRAIGMGTIQAPGGYEWGIDIRDTVPAMSGWNDPLLGAVNNESQRGNYSRCFEGKVTLRTYGDKHFYAATRTQSSIHVMGPASTHTDEYGELGFPPNNTGVVFIGLPAEGPDVGPILQRPLLYQDLVKLVNRKEPFDWEKFLPNPL